MRYHRKESCFFVICLFVTCVTIFFFHPSILRQKHTSRKQLVNSDMKLKIKTNDYKARKNIKSVQSITKTSERSHECINPVPSGFISERILGGLGNWMFSYASAYGVAAHMNSTMVVYTKHLLLEYFMLDVVVVDKCVYQEAIVKYCNKFCSFDANLFNLTKGKSYQIGLYLQSWKYFETVVKEIKKQFTFKPEISEKAQKIIRNITNDYLKKQNGDGIKITLEELTLVGIHVRRGDITNQMRFIKYGYRVASKQYIDKAMDYFTRNFSNVLFVVCSDDMKWSMNNIKGPNVAFVRGNSREVDMSVLIHCNHTIMTVGTFGWWAGFLTGGATVYYKHPAKEGSKLRKHFSKDFSDFFYPRWIGME